MRTPVSMRLAIAAVVLALATAGCGAAPARSPVQSSAPPSPITSAAPSASGPTAAIVWPAPPDPMERTVQAGLEAQPKEFLTNHVHAHLDVFIDGQPVTVPSGIGIKIDDPHVRSREEPDGSMSYGGIDFCDEACISPLHTHDVSGIIHTESASPEPNTLGEFFTEWGVELSETCVGEHCDPTPIAVYVGGEPYEGDPAAIELTDHKVIVIAVGTPPEVIPSTADFSGA